MGGGGNRKKTTATAKDKRKQKKSNKGPRGKKAREKAKLVRQWGEHPTIDDEEDRRNDVGSKNDVGSGDRYGKRNLAKIRLPSPSGNKRRRQLRSDDDNEGCRHDAAEKEGTAIRSAEQRDWPGKNGGSASGGDDDSSESEGVGVVYSKSSGGEGSSVASEDVGRGNGSDEDGVVAWDSLLRSIRSKKKKKERNAVVNGNAGGKNGGNTIRDEDGSVKSDLEGDDFDVESTGATDEGVVDEEDEEFAVRCWRERFVLRPPFPEQDDELRTKQLGAIQRTRTLRSSAGTADGSDDALVVQASHGLADELEQRHCTPALSSVRQLLVPSLSRYADILLTVPDARGETSSNSQSRRNSKSTVQYAISKHLVRHVLRSRTHIIGGNNSRSKEEDDDDDDEDQPQTARDQGFVRPTVLVLLPTRGCCYDMIKRIRNIVEEPDSSIDGGCSSIANKYWQRFEEEYGPPHVPASDETDAKAAARRRRVLQQKGRDWLELFGDDVNDDDDFKLGISLSTQSQGGKTGNGEKRKQSSPSSSMKLFTDFYQSDMIFASPLSLKMVLGAGDGAADRDEDSDAEGEADVKSDRASDFLSSIEVCVVSRADVLLMQNWDHVQDVLEEVNQLPKSSSRTDFSRVREYFLAGQSAHWRQLIVASNFSDPMILSTFKRYARSGDGMIKMRLKIATENASIGRVLLPTRQVFQRVPSPSFATQGEDRIRYFCDNVLQQLIDEKQKHTLVFIPSYFDFVSLRNILLKREDDVDFCSVTEYARTSEIGRGRARFLQGVKPLMLYTGRAHFFHRHAIKGVRHVIFLGLPECPDFYSDHVNRLLDGFEEEADADAPSASSLALFTKYEAHALERIVGSSNCSRMIKGEKSTFLFG